MIIKNCRTGMLSLGYKNEDGSTGSLILIPGFNPKVDAILYHKIKNKNKAITDLIDDGTIEEVHMDKGELDGEVLKPKQVYELILEAKTPKAAVEMVHSCIILEQLESLVKKEKRKIVLEAAKKQIEDLKAPVEHRKE